MSQTEQQYPRMVLKKIFDEETSAETSLATHELVTAVEFSTEDGDELVQSHGSLEDLGAEDLAAIEDETEARANLLGIQFECLLEESDYPEVAASGE